MIEFKYSSSFGQWLEVGYGKCCKYYNMMKTIKQGVLQLLPWINSLEKKVFKHAKNFVLNVYITLAKGNPGIWIYDSKKVAYTCIVWLNRIYNLLKKSKCMIKFILPYKIDKNIINDTDELMEW